MKKTTKALTNPCVNEVLALAIDKMMDDMTIRLTSDGSVPIIEVKHPDGYEYPPIEITVKKIVDHFIKDKLSGSPWDDFMPECTKVTVDLFYNQAVRLKKAFDKYASQKYKPKNSLCQKKTNKTKHPKQFLRHSASSNVRTRN